MACCLKSGWHVRIGRLQNVIASLQISGETDEDVQITEINNVLNQRLKEACKYPNFLHY